VKCLILIKRQEDISSSNIIFLTTLRFFLYFTGPQGWYPYFRIGRSVPCTGVLTTNHLTKKTYYHSCNLSLNQRQEDMRISLQITWTKVLMIYRVTWQIFSEYLAQVSGIDPKNIECKLNNISALIVVSSYSTVHYMYRYLFVINTIHVHWTLYILTSIAYWCTGVLS